MDSEKSPSVVEWELSKENVQPLRHGRKVTSLSAALQPLSGDQLSKIKDQRRVFEIELRTYTGDDPLDVWYRYIKWTEENYPRGGNDGHMSALLEKCISTFKQEEKYKNDQRYLEVWIKFVSQSTNPLEGYTYLYDQGIGCELACLYEAWAWELEKLGNTKKADALFTEGIYHGAEPLDRLQRTYREFQCRAVRQSVENMADTVDQQSSERTVLSQLKGQGKKKTVGSVRVVGNARTGPVGLGLKAPKPQQIGSGFQIYTDENQPPGSSVPPQTGEWKSVPLPAVVNRENDKTPGPWTKAKVSQKTTGVVPISTVSSYKKPSFTVHVDENEGQTTAPPVEVGGFGNTPLCERHPKSVSDSLQHVTEQTPADLNFVPMYKKDQVYSGVEEYQFEELRAMRWLAKKKEVDRFKQELNAALQVQQDAFRQEMSQQMELFRQREIMLLKQQEDFRAQMERNLAKIKKDSSGSADESNRSLQNSTEEIQAGAANITLRQSGGANHQPMGHGNMAAGPQDSHRSNHTLTRQLVYDDLSGPETVKTPTDHQSTDTASNNSMHTPGTNGSVDNLTHSGPLSAGSSNRSFALDGSAGKNRLNRTSIAPSPTVNTKEAFQAVMGLFSDGCEKQFGWSEPANNPPPLDTSSSGNGFPFGGVSSQPFQIFTDNTSAQPKKELDVPKLHQPLINDENRPPLDAPPPGNKRSAGRALLSPAPAPNKSHSKTDKQEEHMEGIEFSSYQYRDDITQAPLGTEMDFAAAARVASTPFSIGSDNPLAIDSSKKGCSRQLSDGMEASVETKPPETTELESSLCGGATNKGLSPIMELSEEDVKCMTANQTKHASHVETHNKLPQTNLVPCDHDGTSPLHTSTNLNQSCHTIDTSGYFPSDENADLLSVSIAIDPRDPFDEIAIQGFLASLSRPISSYPGYHKMEKRMPSLKVNNLLMLDDDTYTVEKKLGEGGFASVYLVHLFELDMDNLHGDDKSHVIKVQRPPCLWEFYICHTLQERLSLNAKELKNTVMSIDKAYFYEDGSFLVNEFHRNGTLLDLVNLSRNMRSEIIDFEPMATFITIELLYIMENLHKCQIIHGDIKPDNFLVKAIVPISKDAKKFEVLSNRTKMLKLIDFGQSIDMTLYPPGTTFTAKVHTSGFQCIEMKTDKPWTYQTDLFGLIGTIHVVMFGEYMNIYQGGGKWKTTSHIPRKWNQSLWKDLFDKLLNIPSCTELPDLAEFRRRFEDHFISNLLPQYENLNRRLVLKMLHS